MLFLCFSRASAAAPNFASLFSPLHQFAPRRRHFRESLRRGSVEPQRIVGSRTVRGFLRIQRLAFWVLVLVFVAQLHGQTAVALGRVWCPGFFLLPLYGIATRF